MSSQAQNADHKWQFKYDAQTNSATLYVVVGEINPATGKITHILAETTANLPDKNLSASSHYSHEVDIREQIHQTYADAGLKINPLPDTEQYPGIYVEVSGTWRSKPIYNSQEMIQHKTLFFGLETKKLRNSKDAMEVALQIGLTDPSRNNNLTKAGMRHLNSFNGYPGTDIRMFSQFLRNEVTGQFFDTKRRTYLINNIESKTGVEMIGASTFWDSKRVEFQISPAIWEIREHDSLELASIVVDPVASGGGSGGGGG